MKKLILSIIFAHCVVLGYCQTYHNIEVSGVEYNTHNSSSGIQVKSISPQTNGTYAVEFYNTNQNDPYYGVSYVTSYCFDWYLSYCGKRVSDYYTSTIRCRKSESRAVYAWPNAVPKGDENYVTIQFGREQVEYQRDRRDDSYIQ